MMKPKIRALCYLSCLLCAGSVLAQQASVAPGVGISTSGGTSTTTVTPSGYTPSLLNSSVSNATASVGSIVNATIQSSYEPLMAEGLNDRSQDELSASSGTAGRHSQFSAMQFPIAGASQLVAKDSFGGGSLTATAMGRMPTAASKLPGAQALSGGGAKNNSLAASSQASGYSLSTSAKPQGSEFSSPGISSAMEKSHGQASGTGMVRGDSSFATYVPNSFPDSTKGTALLSPPEANYGDLFAKTSTASLNFALPDLNDHEFLTPSLHVSAHGGEGEKSLEQRLREHLQNGNGSQGAGYERAGSLHRMASESEIDQLRQQLKSPFNHPLTNSLDSGSSRKHSPMQ